MSAYLGHRGLERLGQLLSERDLLVIRSVQRHRFLTTTQIQELHFYEHATTEAAARICRRVVARLVRDRLLVRLARRVGGVRAGSASFIYALGAVGHRLVADERRFTEPSPLFLDHTLAVADAGLSLIRAHRAGTLNLVEVVVEPTCWRRYIGAGGAREFVRPDLYAITRVGDYEDCWFLEVDRGTESPAAISRKCRGYQGYWRSGREQADHGTFPLVVWVTPDERRAQRIERVISGSRQLKRELFRVTPADQLAELLARGAA